jgi:hypothetical protein
MDGTDRQHYLAGHDRLEAAVYQLDVDDIVKVTSTLTNTNDIAGRRRCGQK